MTNKSKGILINSIICYLGEQVREKNKRLVAQNLYSEQEAFDVGSMFCKLAYMSDVDIKNIASKILG